MRCAYVDAFGGASGDMLLGALIDAGAPLEAINEGLIGLGLDLVVTTTRVSRAGLAALKATVLAGGRPADPSEASAQAHERPSHEHRHHDHEPSGPAPANPTPASALSPHHHHRGLHDIRELISHAGLPAAVAADALRVFERLAEAEAAVHGVSPEEVHFHEVGAADAIGDIVGTCLAISTLKIERLLYGPLPTGRGTVRAAHGDLPVPAPATLQLLRGQQVVDPPVMHEMLTPTGAALLVTLGTQVASLPSMLIEGIGVGAGQRDTDRANILRMVVGTPTPSTDPQEAEDILVLETNLDDASGQILASATERLLEAGALDSWWIPCGMKKGRPGTQVVCLARRSDLPALSRLMFEQLPTLGVRYHTVHRITLQREHRTVQTHYGPVRVKVGTDGERLFVATPEYSDCLELALKQGVAVREVIAAASAAARLLV